MYLCVCLGRVGEYCNVREIRCFLFFIIGYASYCITFIEFPFMKRSWEREEVIGQSRFMWSEPIASPLDHGILVRETKGEKIKALSSLTLRTSPLLSCALYYSH